MTNTTRETALEEATRWFARLRDEPVSMRDRRAFEVWRAESLAHRRAFEEIAGLWQLMDGLEAVPASPPRLRHAGVRRLAAIAASVLVLLAAGWLVATGFGWAPWSGTRYQTAAGEQRVLLLDDGSTVYLNTKSEIMVRFGERRREVRLRAGEALFDVNRNPARPFLVDAGAGRVRVLGTRFNVRRKDHRVAVAVLEGRVDVSAEDGASPGQAAVSLGAGEGVTVDRSGVSAVAEVDTAALTAWRDGRLIYRATPLGEVVADLNRYLKEDIRIGDPQLAELTLTAVFRIEDRDSILHALDAALPVDVVTLPNGLAVLYHAQP